MMRPAVTPAPRWNGTPAFSGTMPERPKRSWAADRNMSVPTLLDDRDVLRRHVDEPTVVRTADGGSALPGRGADLAVGDELACVTPAGGGQPHAPEVGWMITEVEQLIAGGIKGHGQAAGRGEHVGDGPVG